MDTGSYLCFRFFSELKARESSRKANKSTRQEGFCLFPQTAGFPKAIICRPGFYQTLNLRSMINYQEYVPNSAKSNVLGET